VRVEITDRKVVEIEHAKRDDVILAPGRGGLKEIRENKSDFMNGIRLACLYEPNGFVSHDMLGYGVLTVRKQRLDTRVHHRE